jgi:glutaredoxin
MNTNTNIDIDVVEFTKPSSTCYTIYSKSGCPNCKNVKEYLLANEKQFVIIECDEYLLDHKAAFLEFIMNLISMEWKTFPIVFDNEKFIGGFIDTKVYLEQTLEFTERF